VSGIAAVIPDVKLAIPAGFEPATRRLDGASRINCFSAHFDDLRAIPLPQQTHIQQCPDGRAYLEVD
jgi:hypothetical protein